VNRIPKLDIVAAEAREQAIKASSKLEEYRRVQEVSL
jgi:hypothetical protein